MTCVRRTIIGAAIGMAAIVTAAGGVPACAETTPAQNCDLDTSAHRGACIYYDNEVAQFTAPGPAATGFFSLTLDQHDVNHGTDSDGGQTAAPEDPATHGGQGFQSIVSDGTWTGLETHVSYSPAGGPFGGIDQVGWHVDIPQQGDNTYEAKESTYLFDTQTVPYEDRDGDHAIVTNRLSDRPLSIGIADAVPGLTLTQVGTETTGGMLTDPAGRTPGATLTSGTTNYFAGYRSGSNDATLQTTYLVLPPPAGTDPTAPQAIYAGFQVHLDAVVDSADPGAQNSTCSVTSATSLAALNCSVIQGGSNDGQSQVTVSITKP